MAVSTVYSVPDMATQIRRLNKADAATARVLAQLFEEVFEESQGDPNSTQSLAEWLEKPEFIALTAEESGAVVGGLSAYVLPLLASSTSEVFVYNIAVRSSHQRKGIGRMLWQRLMDLCLDMGIKTIFVPAHEEDEHALEFYRNLGGEEERVRQFNFKVRSTKEQT